jgi:hypothetical protein
MMYVDKYAITLDYTRKKLKEAKSLNRKLIFIVIVVTAIAIASGIAAQGNVC